MKRSSNSEVDNLSRKEVKLTSDNNNLFTQLPPEVIHQIVSFLSGSTKFNEFDFFSNRTKEELQPFILPLENIKTLNTLIKYTSKNLRDNLFLITSTSDKSNTMKDESQTEENNAELSLFENHWLNCYNFQEILLYWIRTSGFDSLELGQGDISRREMIKMCKIQNLIQCKERGKVMSKLKEAESADYEDYNEDDNDEEDEEDEDNKKKDKKKEESDDVPFNSEDQAQKDLKERFQQLALSKEDYQQQEGNNNIFGLFIFKSLILSLSMNDYFDCDIKETWGVDSRYLLPSEKIDQWLGDIDYSIPKWKRGQYNKNYGDSNKMIGLSIEDPLGWERFITNTRFVPPEDENEAEKKAQERLRTKQQKELKGQSSNEKEEEEKKQINLGPMISESELREKFSNFIFLNLKNIAFFGEQFKDYIFPNSIQILSLYFDSHDFYKKRPKEEWNNLFQNVTFPNVKYLRIYVDESISENSYYYRRMRNNNKEEEEEEEMKGDELKSLLLKRLLQKNRFPKLNHLVLNGIASENLFGECDEALVKQLMTIEVKPDREFEEGCKEIYRSISRLDSQSLKYVVIQTSLDPRRDSSVSFSDLQDFYSEPSFVFSIGYYSIAQYYYICNE
ncbi:hypothetical protein ABK040_016463 [Willaertia magna]